MDTPFQEHEEYECEIGCHKAAKYLCSLSGTRGVFWSIVNCLKLRIRIVQEWQMESVYTPVSEKAGATARSTLWQKKNLVGAWEQSPNCTYRRMRK